MKLEKKQIVILVSGVVAVLVLVGGAWVLVSSRPNTAAKPNKTSTENVAGLPGENGTGNLANTSTIQNPVAAAMDAPVTDVKTKDEATKTIGDLDTLVDSAGNDVE
jgi:flagellar basal body-associated protein FliL